MARLRDTGELPEERFATAPLMVWAEAIVNQTQPEHQLERAWRNTLTRAAASPEKAQEEERGPAGAAEAAAWRLGWRMRNHRTFVLRTGHQLHLQHETVLVGRTRRKGWRTLHPRILPPERAAPPSGQGEQPTTAREPMADSG